MEAQQLTFGWDIEAHRERDERLHAIFLPKSVTAKDATVAQDKVRFLLDRLNHYAWGDAECYPAQETLASDMGVDQKTVRRTIEAAIGLGLIKVRRKKAERLVCNHYAINWDRIKQLARAVPHPETVGANGQYARSVGASDRTPEGSDRTLRPDQPDITTGATGQYALQPTMVMEDGKEPPPSARASGGGGFKMIWGRKVDEKELFDDERIDVLFGQVMRCGFATEVDRERFAALVVSLRRQKAEGRIGLLTAILEGRVENKFVQPGANPRDWRHRAKDDDHNVARQILKRLDGIGGATSVSPGVAESCELAELESKRRDAKERLAAWARSTGLS